MIFPTDGSAIPLLLPLLRLLHGLSDQAARQHCKSFLNEFYIPAAHSKRIHRYNLIVKQRKPFFVLRHCYWFKRTVSTPRSFDSRILVLKQNRLFSAAVPVVPAAVSSIWMLFIPKMPMPPLQKPAGVFYL
jgi:hypothetical protein